MRKYWQRGTVMFKDATRRGATNTVIEWWCRGCDFEGKVYEADKKLAMGKAAAVSDEHKVCNSVPAQ